MARLPLQLFSYPAGEFVANIMRGTGVGPFLSHHTGQTRRTTVSTIPFITPILLWIRHIRPQTILLTHCVLGALVCGAFGKPYEAGNENILEEEFKGRFNEIISAVLDARTK
jgi:hypothetical protein